MINQRQVVARDGMAIWVGTGLSDRSRSNGPGNKRKRNDLGRTTTTGI